MVHCGAEKNQTARKARAIRSENGANLPWICFELFVREIQYISALDDCDERLNFTFGCQQTPN